MPDTLNTIIENLHARGERLTVQRRLVLEVLYNRHDHLTIQDIQAELRQRQLEITETTIYRILQWLKDVGIVSQTDLGQQGIVYQVIGASPHHHLVCLSCGHIEDVNDSLMAGLRDRLLNDYHFLPRIDHMAFFGLCRRCQDRSTPDAS